MYGEPAFENSFSHPEEPEQQAAEQVEATAHPETLPPTPDLLADDMPDLSMSDALGGGYSGGGGAGGARRSPEQSTTSSAVNEEPFILANIVKQTGLADISTEMLEHRGGKN